MVSKYINTNDFVVITTDKFVEEGLAEGQQAYIAGHKALPIDKEDPYTQRIKFLVHPIVDKHVVFDKIYLLDALSMSKLHGFSDTILRKILEEDLDAMPD